MERQAKFIFRRPKGPKYNNITLNYQDTEVPALEVVTNPGLSKTLLYFHGGAYIFGSASSHARLVAKICKDAGINGFSINYRLAPEHPFPAAFDDAMAAYMALLEKGIPSNEIIIGGDSAGGGLALALLGDICEQKLPIPAALFALSPWIDLTLSGNSLITNAKSEHLLPPERIKEARDMYLSGNAPSNPHASPHFANFDNAPPVYLTVGDTEIFLDDTVLIGETLREQGCDVTVEITKNTPHVLAYFHGFAPEANVSMARVVKFIQQY